MTYEESLRRFRKRGRLFGIPLVVTFPMYAVTIFQDFSFYTNWCALLLFQFTVFASVLHRTVYRPIPPDTDLSVYIPRFKWKSFGTVTLGCVVFASLPFLFSVLVSTESAPTQKVDPQVTIIGSVFVVWCLGCAMISHGLKHTLQVHSEYSDSDPGEDPAAATARHSSA